VEISTAAAQPRGEQTRGDRGARGSSTQRQGIQLHVPSLSFASLLCSGSDIFLVSTNFGFPDPLSKIFFIVSLAWSRFLVIRNTSSVVKLFRILTSVKLSFLSVSRIFKVGIGPHSPPYLTFLFYHGVFLFGNLISYHECLEVSTSCGLTFISEILDSTVPATKLLILRTLLHREQKSNHWNSVPDLDP
jgi:hypothetical protein